MVNIYRSYFSRLFSFIKRNKHTLLLSTIFLVGVALFAIVILIDRRITGSDDTVFQTQTLPYHNVIDWIVYRYQSWSGRFFSEGFEYIFSRAPLYFWQIISIGMYALFSAMLFAYYKLFDNKRSHAKDYVFLAVALCLPFLADKDVFAGAVTWVTSSMAYFWITAIGLVAFYPIAYFVTKKRKPHLLISVIGVISAIVAASSQEQVGAVLLGLSLAFLIYLILTTPKLRMSKVPWYLVFFSAVIGASLLVSVLAPGDTARLKAELATWLPDFYTTPISQRIDYSYRWLLDAFINHTGFLLILSWALMAVLLVGKKVKSRLDYIFILLLIVSCLFALSKGFVSTAYWTNFYATWKPSLPNTFISLNLLPWGVVLIATVVAPLVLFRKQSIGYVLSLLFATALASAAILLLSPTLYASEWRSFFVPSVVLMITVYLLLYKVLYRYWTYSYILLGVVITLAFSNYLFQVVRLIQNFHQ